jgi:hypothetical protein
MKKDYTNYLVEQASKFIDENKKLINESVKYPTQEEAQLAVDFANFYWNLSFDGTTIGFKIIANKLHNIVRDIREYAFNENSPWYSEKNKSGKLIVKWSDSKAKKLGLEK